MVEQSINYVFKGPVTSLVFSVLYNITPHIDFPYSNYFLISYISICKCIFSLKQNQQIKLVKTDA